MEADAPSKSESISGVLGMALGLLLIGVAFWPFLSPTATTELDGAAILDERFDVAGNPFGFEVLEAFGLTGGEELVVLGDPSAERLQIAGPISFSFSQGGSGSDDGGEFSGRGRGERGGSRRGDGGGGKKKGDNVWSKLVIGEAEHAPAEIVIVWYAFDQAEAILKRQFAGARFGDLSDVGEKGGRLVVDSGEIDWGGYTTHYLRERVFRKVDDVPGFYDTMRVNLTLDKTCCVLYAVWTPGLPGSKGPIEEALQSLRPRPVPEE